MIVNPNVILPHKGESYNPKEHDYLDKLENTLAEKKQLKIDPSERNKKIEKRKLKVKKQHEADRI